MSLLAKVDKSHFRITISVQGCSSFIYWRHECESAKIIYLDATESLICSRALLIVQTVNMDGESGNLKEIVIWLVNRAISRKL